MPDKQTTTGVMDEPAEAGSLGNNGGQNNENKGSTRQTLAFLRLGQNRGGLRIDKVILNAEETVDKTLAVEDGATLEIDGAGLEVIDSVLLLAEGVRGFTARPKSLVIERTKGRYIKFQIPNLDKVQSATGVFVVELRSQSKPEASGVLYQFLRYKKKSNKGEEEQEGQKGGAGAAGRGKEPGGGFAKGAIGRFVDVGGQALEKSLGAMVGIDAGGKAKQQAAPSRPKPKDIKAEEGSSGSDEETSTGWEEVLPLQDSLDIVGEHLDKNPELIVDRSTRENVLQALSSGDFSGLSPQGHEALQKVIKGYTSGGQGVSVQLQQASQVINDAYVSVGGRISGTVEVSAEAQVTGGAGVTATVQSTTSAKSSAAAVSGAGNLSLRQSLDIVGEYLGKNPQLIVKTKVRGRVLEALGSGNLDGLDDESKTALQGVLRMSVPQEQTGAIRLQAALQNVEGAMPGPVEVSAKVSASAAPSGVAVAASIPAAEEKPAPQVSARANGPKEAEAGLQAVKQAGADLPEARQQAGGSPAKPAGGMTHPPVGGAVEPLAPSGVQPETGGSGEAAEPSADGKAAAAAIGRKVDGVGAPKGDLAALKAALDRNNAAVAQKLGLKGAKQPPTEGGKDVVAAPGRSPEDVSAGKDSEKGLSGKVGRESGLPKGTMGQEPGAAGSKLPAVPGGLGQGLGGPEVPPPLNPEELQEGSEGQPEEGQENNSEGEEPEGEEGGGGPVEETADQSPQKKIAAAAEKNRKLQAEIKKTADTVNKLIDKYLMSVVATVWGSALPSFGLAVLLGAVVGDFLWAFKNSLVKRFLTPLLRTEGLKRKAEEIARQIKISGKVKANIAAMNLVVIVGLLLTLLFVFSVLWGVCNSWTTYMLTKVSGMDQVCEMVNKSMVGTTLSSMRSSGSFSASYNTPGSLTGTAQWTNQINTYAQKYNIDACIMRVVVQKESSGSAQSIGHDGHSSSGDPFDLSSPPKHNLNWQYSHGIGLTQWTIFSNGSGWMDNQTPSRKIFNSWYKVTDLLDPNTSLDLTAHDFSNKLAANLNSQPDYNNALRMSFAQYNGGGSPNASAMSYADASMALYNMCKSNNTQFKGGDGGGGGASERW